MNLLKKSEKLNRKKGKLSLIYKVLKRKHVVKMHQRDGKTVVYKKSLTSHKIIDENEFIYT